MRKSTMVTFTSGDRHRFEPPRTQTAFIDLAGLDHKKAIATDLARKLQSFGFSDQFFLARKKNPRLASENIKEHHAIIMNPESWLI